MAIANGQRLQERYHIISKLGTGGMGAVYQAQDTRLNVRVALKEMFPPPNLDAASIHALNQQFQQEAQILARLKHPHLVRVSDYFIERGNAYLVMDFIQGHSLAEHIRRTGPLPEDQVVTWGGQLLDALAYCHAQDIIHRDVKPQNVIIQSNGDAVLVDFGLVKLWDPDDPRTKTAMHGMGTPEYAPPEQYGIAGGHTDARSDIYSVGATLYHALTGHAPPTATLRMADPEHFKPLQTIAPHVSKNIAKTIMKALELARSQRWQRAEEMAEALGYSISTTTLRVITEKKTTSTGEEGKTVTMTGPMAPIKQLRTVPLWGWGVGGVIVIALIIGLVFGRGDASPLAHATATPTIAEAISTPSPSPTLSPTPSPTPRNSPTPRAPKPEPSSTSPPTETPTQTPSPTSQPPTATPIPRSPTLTGPAQGGTYASPITFQWDGTLGAGQSYQVTAYHSESRQTLRSDPLTAQSWTADLPGDKFGEWRWSVSVLQGGSAIATSPEGMFWFNPCPGCGDGGGDDGPQPTPTR
ncbi:MAG: protein kinase domain-containing protein [Anaerolineales bacterium]